MKSENKYWEFTEEEMHHFGHRLRRIRALVDLPDRRVKKGETGGWVSDSAEISGLVWVYDEARVYGSSRVSDSAEVSGSAWVYGNAQITGSARVSGAARVHGLARVYGSARVSGSAEITSSARIYGSAQVSDSAKVVGSARVYGRSLVYGWARIVDEARVAGSAEVFDLAWVCDGARVCGEARVYGSAWVAGLAEVSGGARVKVKSHVMTLTSIGSKDSTVNLVRTEKGHYLQVGCWEGTVQTLMEEVYKGSEKWVCDAATKQQWIKEYQALEMLAMERVAAWERARSEEATNQ